MFLIDTVTLSELRKRQRDPVVVAWFERQRATELFLSVISIGEIERGIELQRATDTSFAGALTAWLDRMLVLYGSIMVTEKDEFVYHEMLSHVALFSHPNPKRVLIIGGGDGGTLREVLRHKGVRATMVEIDEMVVKTSQEYLPTIGTAITLRARRSRSSWTRSRPVFWPLSIALP